MDMRGLTVDKPSAGGASQGQNDTIILVVKGDGNIFCGNQQINLEAVRPTVKRLCGKERLPVVIQADQNAQSGLVIRIVDEAKMGGAKDVSLATDKT
jgi:biopolymer transport protein ExbD